MKPQEPQNQPMTRRGPDGRAHATDETEQRATEAQKADAEKPRSVPLPVAGNPD